MPLVNLMQLQLTGNTRVQGVTAYQADYAMSAVTLRVEGSAMYQPDQRFNLAMADLGEADGEPAWLLRVVGKLLLCCSSALSCCCTAWGTLLARQERTACLGLSA